MLTLSMKQELGIPRLGYPEFPSSSLRIGLDSHGLCKSSNQHGNITNPPESHNHVSQSQESGPVRQGQSPRSRTLPSHSRSSLGDLPSD